MPLAILRLSVARPARWAALSAVALLSSACSTIVTGTSQTIAVNTTPAGASCTVDRNGERIGSVAETPGSVRISKSSKPLEVECREAGYLPATVRRSPDFQPWTVGNVLIGGLLGLGIDAASGAISVYPSNIQLGLSRDPNVPASLPPLAAQPTPQPALSPAPGQSVARYTPAPSDLAPLPVPSGPLPDGLTPYAPESAAGQVAPSAPASGRPRRRG